MLLHKRLPLFATANAHWRRATGVSLYSCTPFRQVHHEVSAANFNKEVLESQQAICFVYYIDNGNCRTFLKSAEALVDKINEETSGTVPEVPADTAEDSEVIIEGVQQDGSPSAPGNDNKKKKSISWLKLCQINADENRNLSSAFSVERSKLPVTYFIMQGTIIDKISGHVSEKRLESILYKFLEHYQEELNVDLLSKRNKENESDPNQSPLPSATRMDLTKGASTSFLLEKVYAALIGTEHISLPEEAEQMDGLRKTIQQTKQKAHEELQALYRELGLDVRKWSETELMTRYYNNSVFISMGLITALEGVFLARSYASLGDVARQNVLWARNDVTKNFEHALGDKRIKTALSVLDANLVKGELRMAAITAAQDANRLCGALSAMESDNTSEAQHMAALREMNDFIESQKQHILELMNLINESVDTRATTVEYPTQSVEILFTKLKDTMKLRRQLQSECEKSGKGALSQTQAGDNATTSTSLVEPEKELNTIDVKPKQLYLVKQREEHIKTILTCVIQLHAADPKSQSTRSRLSSLLY
ncbi:hypothetical protein AGDE_10042 [Angomonas deanei]|nr:hypothetical protein AGDE_10042 [Angomonas deanei]|eukprot:EPY29266.1 hypothetical protein AGDE_10042 [Angomonas deanei]